MDTIAVALANKLSNGGIMVNFGGDLSAIRPKLDQTPWIIEIENPKAPQSTLSTIKLRQGAIATSGNAKRFAINNKGKNVGIHSESQDWLAGLKQSSQCDGGRQKGDTVWPTINLRHAER